jgi:hypothetical protein
MRSGVCALRVAAHDHAGAVTLFLGGNTPLTRGIPLPHQDDM